MNALVCSLTEADTDASAAALHDLDPQTEAALVGPVAPAPSFASTPDPTVSMNTSLHLFRGPGALAPPEETAAQIRALIPEAERAKWMAWLGLTRLGPRARAHHTADAWGGLPSLALWVRTFHPGRDKLLTLLYDSHRLFWPQEYGQFVVVLDDESEVDHAFGALLQQLLPHPHLGYMGLPADPTIWPGGICGRNTGYDRQMYSGFFADRFTDAEVIAIVDNDSLFTTVPTPPSLFDDGRPVVIGKQSLYNIGKLAGRWAHATEVALGLPQAADFMFNFPILIKRNVFGAVRRHISQQLNTTFDEAFRIIARDPESYCQINIILNYAWYFHRGEYTWHLSSMPGSKGPMINGTYNVPAPRVAQHARGLYRSQIQNYVRTGYCHACIASGNCLNATAQARMPDLNHWRHVVLLNWDHTGHVWDEARWMGKTGSAAYVQEHHYRAVRAVGHQWPAGLGPALTRHFSYHSDCSRPEDSNKCLDSRKVIHKRDQDLLQFQGLTCTPRPWSYPYSTRKPETHPCSIP